MSLTQLQETVARTRLACAAADIGLAVSEFGPETPIRKLVDFVEEAISLILDATVHNYDLADQKTVELGPLLGPAFEGDQAVFTTALWRGQRDVLGATLGPRLTIFQCTGLSRDELIMTPHLINALAHELYHLLQEKFGIEGSVHAGAKYVNPRGKNRTSYLTSAAEVQARVLPYVAQYIRDPSQRLDGRADFVMDIWTLIKRDDPEFYHTVLGTPLEAEIERVISEAYEHAQEETSAVAMTELGSVLLEIKNNTAVSWSRWLQQVHVASGRANSHDFSTLDGVTFTLQPDAAGVYLCNLKSAVKQQGHARAALVELTEAADRVGVTIALDAIAGAGGMRQSQLERFYRSLGFRNDGGSNRMLYRPAETASVEVAAAMRVVSSRVLTDVTAKIKAAPAKTFKARYDYSSMNGALIECVKQVKKHGVAYYAFVGNSYMNVVFHADYRRSMAFDPISNTGTKVLEVSPDLTVTEHTVDRTKRAGAKSKRKPREQAAVEVAANWMYHGTPHSFDEFRVDAGHTMIDRAIGVHFAADESISRRFAAGLYQDKVTGAGRMIRVRAPRRSKVLVVKQQRYAGGRQSDQSAIGAFVAATAFEKNEGLFLDWIKRARGVEAELGLEVYNLLKGGRAPADKRFGLARTKNNNSLRSYVANFDSGLHAGGDEIRRKVVREFGYQMMMRGVDALIYENTSPSEIKDADGKVVARSTKSYIVLAHALDRYRPELPEGATMFDRFQRTFETAKGEWWDTLTPQEQQDYLDRHPDSKLRVTSKRSNDGRPHGDEPKPAEDKPAEAPAADKGKLRLRKGMTAAADRASLPAHIKQLRLPPAWTNLQYNDDPDADLLVIGVDAKGRDQYVYSPRFVEANQVAKFARIREVDTKFEGMVEQTRKDQAGDDQTKATHALVAELVFLTGIRPGSDDDTGAEKKAYGATTLEARHIVTDENGTRLKFTGKKGVDLDLPVTDQRLAKLLSERAAGIAPGEQLFSNVSDSSLRDYVKTLDGGDFKTKDIRTALGTRLAREAMRTIKTPLTSKDYKAAAREVGKVVSQVLGNTPAVALTSYIDPTLFTEWRQAAGA